QCVAATVGEPRTRRRPTFRNRTQIGQRGRRESHWTAHPKLAAAIADNLDDRIAEQTFLGSDPRHFAVRDPDQARTASSDPKNASIVGKDRPHAVAIEFRECRVRYKAAFMKPVDPPVGADQHVPVAVLHNRTHPTVREAMLEIVILEARPVPDADAAGRADPEIAFGVFREGLKTVVAQAFARGEAGNLPVRQTHYSLVVGSEPHRSVSILEYPAKTQGPNGIGKLKGLRASIRKAKHFARDRGEPESSVTIRIDS